ncbi:MAG: glycosyltransferase family 4 protein [bacterium]
MKIALIHKTFSSYGGTERYITNLSGALLKAGHEVHIFANTWADADGIQFHRVPLWKFGKAVKILSFAWFARNLIEKTDFDIVQGFGKTVKQDIFRAGGGAHRAWMKESLMAIKNPFLRNLKYIKRVVSPAQWLTISIERQTFRKGNYKRVIAVSERVKRQIMDYHHVPPQDIVVIHNGVDLSVFHTDGRQETRGGIRERFGIDDTDILLVFASTNFHLKGLEYLIRGMVRAGNPALKLLVVGGDNRLPFERLASRLGIVEKVVFAGKGKNMREFYQAGDIFCYPTLYDPFANVCLEAMACALPVITSRVNGVADIIQDGLNGLLLRDPTDDVEIAEKISWLIDSGKRSEMSEMAYRQAPQYSMDRHIEKILTLYADVAAEKRGGVV